MTYSQINPTKVGGFLFLIVLILVSGCYSNIFKEEVRTEYKLKDCVLLNLNVGDSERFVSDFNHSDVSKVTSVTIICEGISGRSVVYTGGYVSDIEFNKLVNKYNSSISGNVEVSSHSSQD